MGPSPYREMAFCNFFSGTLIPSILKSVSLPSFFLFLIQRATNCHVSGGRVFRNAHFLNCRSYCPALSC